MTDLQFDHPVISDEESNAEESRRGSDSNKTYISRTSTSSGVSRFFRNPWGKIIHQDDVWSDSDADFKPKHALCLESIGNCCSQSALSIKRIALMTIRNPTILVPVLLSFCLLCVVGISVMIIMANNYEKHEKDIAIDIALETGTRVSRQLDSAILPLFTMSQFVKQLPAFHDLPRQIGPGGSVFSAPFRADTNNTHRDVRGICDEPNLLNTFNSIASNVKKDANMQGILVNIQIAPHAVVCLLNPVVNTEDFPPGTVLNNTAAIGHDLLNDPKRTFIARATIPAYPNVVTAGPLKLIQGDKPIVKEALIARRAIYMDGYDITVDGVSYPCWGFAVIILNWAEVKKASGIDKLLKDGNFEWNLTRTDTKVNSTTNEKYDKVVSIGSSSESDILNDGNSVSVELDETTNNRWKMTIGKQGGFRPPWFPYLCSLTVFLSLVMSIMLCVVLSVKKEFQVLLYDMMPRDVIRRLNNNKTVCDRYVAATVFFSDIVGFTAHSASVSAIDVMEMLNDLFSEFDALVKKHQVYKVETIGDAYIVIGGGPDKGLSVDGAEKVALFALDAMKVVENFKTKQNDKIYIRAGLGSGPVVAGVVGRSQPKFTLFGDTVNTASRMESTSKKMKIQCNTLCQTFLLNSKNFTFDLEERMEGDEKGIEVKGKGRIVTYWIHGVEPRVQSASDGKFEENPDEEHLASSEETEAEVFADKHLYDEL